MNSLVVFYLSSTIVFTQYLKQSLSTPTNYDQRQNGNFNVQVNIKSVKVVALTNLELLDDYTQYDYFYDYADLTVKPPSLGGKPTTSKPNDNNNVTATTENKNHVTTLSIIDKETTKSSSGNVEILSTNDTSLDH